MAREYSAWSLVRHALGGHAAWPRAWRDAALRPHYDAIVVGGGGHGLATAYYLAKIHGVRRVAVLEKGWIGGGNTGRNTTVVRSNYFFPESARLYDLALRLYEGLAEELNFNIMLSQRGMMMLAQSRHDRDMLTRSTNAMLVNGIDAELLDAGEVRRRIPALAADRDMRFPLWGALNQPRGGI